MPTGVYERKKMFTLTQIKFLEKNIAGIYYEKLAELFNKHFKADYSVIQISNFCKRQGWKNGLPGGGQIPGKFRYVGGKPSAEIECFIRDKVKKQNNSELAESIKERFGLSYTAGHVKYIRNCLGIKSTSGRKYKPVGTERISPNGYTIVKISDTGIFSDDWKFKHILIWENANGSVPEGNVILFADQDRNNFDPDNLLCVSRSELSQLNKNKLLFENKDLTKTSVAILRHKAVIKKAITKRKEKQSKQGECNEKNYQKRLEANQRQKA